MLLMILEASICKYMNLLITIIDMLCTIGLPSFYMAKNTLCGSSGYQVPIKTNARVALTHTLMESISFTRIGTT